MSISLPEHGDNGLLEAWTGQPELFDGLDLATSTVTAARNFLHTGKTVTSDERAAARIVAAASLGWSTRRISRELGHSRNTIAAVVRLAEKAGKVEPVKDRVLAAAAESIHSDIELGDQLAQKIREGLGGERALSELAAFRRGTWVGAGILADKGSPPPPSVAVQVNVGAGSVVQVVQEYATRLKGLTDSKSGAFQPETSANSAEPDALYPKSYPIDPNPSTSSPIPDSTGAPIDQERGEYATLVAYSSH